MNTKILLTALVGTLATWPGAEAGPVENFVDYYRPIEGGWEISISGNSQARTPAAGSRIGVVEGNARLHRRPLYPPADKTLVWTAEELAKLERCGFRPLVLAYNEPRFLFDFHSAGGLLGHLQVGLTSGGASKWFHQWSDITVRYVDGRMEYTLRDEAFPGAVVKLVALPLADSVGLVLKVSVSGLKAPESLVWAYGGASAFFTNYAMDAPEFRFAPQQCAKDFIRCDEDGFELSRAFDKSDVYVNEIFAAARYLTNWQAVIRGGSSWKGRTGFGRPEGFTNSPLALANGVELAPGSGFSQKSNCAAVQSVPLTGAISDGFIVVGMGGRITADLRSPENAWRKAEVRQQSIARRVVTHTPDPYLDAAVRMMAFATEGTWGDSAFVHGGWSWRFAYLGWRTWYGPTCYGWTDRVRRSIQNHTRLGLVREGPDAGALGSLLEYNPGVYYNMNEVFLDHVRQYFDYTNDLDLMREIFPVLIGILDWENRRLQPGNEYLYESALNTWISDSHWYIQGQCTQASAYMLGANRFVADLARRLGKDPTPFEERARRIRAAMQEKLWQRDAGVFAEYLDTRGHRLLHPEPELATIYHAAEFGAADASQIYQMLRWADTNLRHETTPGSGKLVWSSNWYPNRGRSYTHSTYEMAYGEELNLALTDYLVGRADDAYAILRATLCGIFNSPTPGGLSCHAYADGRQRANDEFADASSMWGRAVAEGLFGIKPKRPDGVVELSPQFPKDWDHAEIDAPHFSYRWQRKGGTISIEWKSPVETRVKLKLPLRAETVQAVRVDGKRDRFGIASGFDGLSWVNTETPEATSGHIQVAFTPQASRPAEKLNIAPSMPTPSPRLWKQPQAGDHDLRQWTLIDMSGTFNDSVTNVLRRVSETAKPPPASVSQVNFGYWRDHLLQYHGSRNQEISDAAWRNKVGADGTAWTTDGIPFATRKAGPNIGVVTLAGGYPTRLDFPVKSGGQALYVMLSGMTFPVQSHVVNLRLTLRYADGQEHHEDLENPFGIGDCWSTWCGRFHDTVANGFENIGGRSGPAGSSQVAELTQPVALDTEAHLLALPLRAGVELNRVELEAIANDCIFGIMGATILR